MVMLVAEFLGNCKTRFHNEISARNLDIMTKNIISKRQAE